MKQEVTLVAAKHSSLSTHAIYNPPFCSDTKILLWLDVQKSGDTTFPWTKALSNQWMEDKKKNHRRCLSLISILNCKICTQWTVHQFHQNLSRFITTSLTQVCLKSVNNLISRLICPKQSIEKTVTLPCICKAVLFWRTENAKYFQQIPFCYPTDYLDEWNERGSEKSWRALSMYCHKTQAEKCKLEIRFAGTYLSLQ